MNKQTIKEGCWQRLKRLVFGIVLFIVLIVIILHGLNHLMPKRWQSSTSVGAIKFILFYVLFFGGYYVWPKRRQLKKEVKK